MADTQYYEGIGRRKTSTARVRLMDGTGSFLVNGKELPNYFPRTGDVEAIWHDWAPDSSRVVFDGTKDTKNRHLPDGFSDRSLLRDQLILSSYVGENTLQWIRFPTLAERSWKARVRLDRRHRR